MSEIARDIKIEREKEIIELSKKLFRVSDSDFEILKEIVSIFDESSGESDSELISY